MSVHLIATDDEFGKIIQTSPFVVVDYFSTDCPPCSKLAPTYERYAALHPEIIFLKIFRQEHRELAKTHNVSSSPTVILFKNGVQLDSFLSGDIDDETFKKFLIDAEFITEKSEEKTVSETRDLCIIGTGPAGLSAAVYAARYKIDQIIVGELDGGLMTSSHKICNYPSENEISGMDLTDKMVAHVKQLEVPFKSGQVTTITRAKNYFEVTLANNEIIHAKKILLATGTVHRHLGIENEHELVGRGISYCATCDAMFYKNKTVAVIGGSDSANTAALYLADIAKKVYQVYRGSALRGEVAWIDQIKQNEKIESIFNSEVKKINGTTRLESIEISNQNNETSLITIDGLFIEVGSSPDPKLLTQLALETDAGGYIKTDEGQKTSCADVWAAGDITTGSDGFRQIITACSEGSIAARNIFQDLLKN
jgi:thioredoxin reductase (NADPH)